MCTQISVDHSARPHTGTTSFCMWAQRAVCSPHRCFVRTARRRAQCVYSVGVWRSNARRTKLCVHAMQRISLTKHNDTHAPLRCVVDGIRSAARIAPAYYFAELRTAAKTIHRPPTAFYRRRCSRKPTTCAPLIATLTGTGRIASELNLNYIIVACTTGERVSYRFRSNVPD